MTRLGICIAGEVGFDEIIRRVRVCDHEESFESVWIAEDYFFRDAVSVAASFASLTRNMRICLGIVNPYTRNPALLAMTFATLDEISAGRLVIGMGPGVRSKYIRMGIKAEKRLSTLRDTVHVLRRLLKHESVTIRGATFQMQSVRLDLTPVRENVPIYLAAVGPKMLQLAGEIADGVLLTAASSPAYVRKALENIRIGAEKSGKDPSSVDVACYVICSLSDSSQEALEAARAAVASNIAPAEYGRLILEETGLDPAVFDRITRVDTNETGVKISPQVVSDDVVDALSASGTTARFRERLDEYVSSGVALPILYPVGSCFDNLIGYLRQSA